MTNLLNDLNDLNDPYVLVGLGLIVTILMVVTIDIVVIPTMIASIVVLAGWAIYLIYVYNQDPVASLFLGGVFLLVGGVYLFVVVKLKLWKWVAQEKKVPLPKGSEDYQEEIRHFNEGEVIAQTDLRPVGKIRVGGKTLDGLSEIGFIPKGTVLTITSYAEGQYKVKKK